MIRNTLCRAVSLLVVAALALPIASQAAPKAPTKPGFVATVEATQPLAYFRLTDTTGSSEVGRASYAALGATAASSSCAPIGVPAATCRVLDGKSGYFGTTQTGGIGSAGSILAWVYLSAVPATVGRIIYIAGESQVANDFDMQFESDNALHFYTVSGSNVSYAPPVASIAQHWHMVVATFDATTGARAVYWDGKLGKRDSGGGTPGKKSEFTIGESKVFTGRFFPGTITDVAVWDRALSATTVASIYASRLNAP